MKAETMKMPEFDEIIANFESIYEHRKAHPTLPSEEIYYKLLLKYFQQIRSAKEEGKYIAACSVIIPTEIFYAMDIVPMGLETVPITMFATLNKQEEAFSTASGFGYKTEICSAHRCAAAATILDWLPRPDFVIWSNMVCDNTTKSGDIFVERYNSVPFFVDCPYRYTEREAQYLTQELEELVHVLEKHTHRKMDWDRLSETVEYSRQMVELHREIYELRKAIPEPARNRQTFQIIMAHWYFGGDPEAVTYLTAIRDELKKKVEEKKGYVPEERFRLLTLFVPPMAGGRKLLDWMEREHGATMVADPYISHWGDVEMDPSKPIESLARKLFSYPVCRQMLGPMDEGVVRDTVNDAIDYKADGAVYFAHVGCRQSCAAIRTVKDALKNKVGIPTLTLDLDIMDPTFASMDKLKGKLEGFFEMLEDRK